MGNVKSKVKSSGQESPLRTVGSESRHGYFRSHLCTKIDAVFIKP